MFPVIIICIVAAALVGGAYLTNPFNRLHIIKRPYIAMLTAGKLQIRDHNNRLKVKQQWYWRAFAIAKCGIHILSTRYIKSPRSRATDVKGIIADIRKLRFNPHKLLLTSGDHFSALFVRNLGVFYYPTLDPAIADSEVDWQHRQIVYLQTVAYALGVFAKSPTPTTTIVATGPYSATCVNFYAYPSDTVYGILYALAALQGSESAQPVGYTPDRHSLVTQPAARQLTSDYRETLTKLYADYRQTVYDESSGLISTGVHLSGAKDITRRSSAFYDNVIFWKTTQLASRLGIIEPDAAFLRNLKRRILQTFWLPDKGYFLEDLSPESRRGAYYSSDWLIVLATGFLDPQSSQERHYFTDSVSYIQQSGTDQPFALRYHADTRAHRQFLAVRLAVASYGGDAIWSFWGMEYIKLLLILYSQDREQHYLEQADKHINAYRQAMVRDGGFPEVYDGSGHLLQTPLYRSIRQTGWVVGFEQVCAMRDTIA